MSQVRAEDVTRYTRIIECSQDYYDSVAKSQASPETYFNQTMYLVNKGSAIQEGEDQLHPVTDLFFGSRKVTDIVTVTEYPGNVDYPDDKMYLLPYYNNKVSPLDPVGYNLYYKHKGVVTPITTSALAEVHPSDDGTTVRIAWRGKGPDGEQTGETITILATTASTEDTVPVGRYEVDQMIKQASAIWEVR